MTQNTKDRVIEAATAYLRRKSASAESIEYWENEIDIATDAEHFAMYCGTTDEAMAISTMWDMIDTDKKSHADLITKLDGIIFDPDRPTPVRNVASDVVRIILESGDPMAQLRCLMANRNETGIISGCLTVRAILKEAGQ